MRDLLLKTGRGTYHCIASTEIVYVERLKGRTRVFLKDKNLRVIIPFPDLLGQLDDNFIQCHRRFFVNLSYVKEFTTRNAKLKQGVEIPIGLTYKNEFINNMINSHV